MIFIILSLLTLIFYSKTVNKPNSKWPSILLVVGYIVVFSMRSMAVADTEPYYDVYTGFIDPNMEIGYLFLNTLFRNWEIPFSQFLLFVAIFDLFFWYHFTKIVIKQNNILISLALFMSNMGMIYYGIVLRSGMASSIMMIPISYMLLTYENDGLPLRKHSRKLEPIFKLLFLFVVCLLVAGLFHQSIYVVVLALVIYYIPIPRKTQYLLLITALFISSISSIPHLISFIVQPILEDLGLRMSGRFDQDIVHGLSMYQIINVCIGFIYIHLAKYIKSPVKRKQYELILSLYIVGVFMSGAFSFLVAGARIGHLLIFYEFFLPALLLNKDINKLNKKKITIVLILIILVNFVRNFYGTPSLIDYIS